ncbi:hypothetical protein L9F63_023450, partial [Diploptera punctata]
VIPDNKENEASQQPAEDMTEGQDDKHGVGQAQREETDAGHQGQMTELKENVQAANQQQEIKREKRQHFQESDSNRSLGEVSEPLKKKLKTMNLTSEEEKQQEDKDEDDEGAEHGEDAEMYQHIKQANKSTDIQTLDAATEEQAEQQPVPNLEDEEGEELKDDEIMEIQSESEPEVIEAPEQDAEKISSNKQPNEKEQKVSGENVEEGGDIKMEVEIEVEGEKIETLGVARGNETTFHTVMPDVEAIVPHEDVLLMEDHETLRSQLENQLATWSEPPPDAEAEKTWEMFSAVTAGLARDLSEQLRLVLEPTQASRLQGDYRTGRRINMRKIIAYIASQFRKDKIWMRRTKPCKREYQIVLAIDDSSSMADNHSKELAFESLALVSRALTLLEAGELSNKVVQVKLMDLWTLTIKNLSAISYHHHQLFSLLSIFTFVDNYPNCHNYQQNTTQATTLYTSSKLQLLLLFIILMELTSTSRCTIASNCIRWTASRKNLNSKQGVPVEICFKFIALRPCGLYGKPSEDGLDLSTDVLVFLGPYVQLG